MGKVEAGIPEDDPRNPAVIADLVGDNVGDCAGRGADIFESTAAENVGAMILGTALYPVFGIKGILFPLIVHAINLVASFVGVLVVHSREDQDPMDALNRGYYVTTLLALAGFAGAVYYMLQGRWWLLSCGVVGMVTSFLFVRITEYYTETRYRPVQSIANASLTGPATNIISGLAVGMETPAMPVVVISAALLLSYYFGVRGLADATDLRLRQGHIRHRHCYHGHALVRGLHSGHGYLRADYRQCRRNHRNVGSAGFGAGKDRQAGRGRQHHQGADQGLCHRLCRTGRLSAVLRVPGDGPRHRGATLRGCSARCSTPTGALPTSIWPAFPFLSGRCWARC